MAGPKSLTEALSNPARDECQTRILKLAADLEAEGYTLRDIAGGGLLALLEVSRRGDIPTHRGFLRKMGAISAMSGGILDKLAADLKEIRAEAH